ncbi:MAG: RNA 2',3'-cyclic phosphodiesterase [Lachnospiraceae bacterium]|nr:RNA 2',3'-cyclic phosphodiesterase [Lachnospiraceae bacterium]
MRLFVAIELSDEMKKASVEVMHALKQSGVKGNYTPIRNLHVTLCFIGEVDDRKPVENALATVKFKPFKLAFSELGSFGELLHIGIRGGQGINNLASDIRKAFDAAGIEYDKKKFVPHMTLVRKAAGRPVKVQVPDVHMMVKRVSLMKSERVDGKMVYTEMFHI